MIKNRDGNVFCILLILMYLTIVILLFSGCGCENSTIVKSREITFAVGACDAKPGEKGIAITVSVKNNPGFASARLEISFDDSLVLSGFEYNKKMFEGMSTVPYNANANPPTLSVTSVDKNITGDFDFATLYFDVSDKANGNCEINLSCGENDVYDIEDNNLECSFCTGIISIVTDSESTSKADEASVSKDKHTVVFKDENGKVISSQSVYNGESAQVPTAPTKEGYVFIGWSESVDKITEDKTLTPVYEALGFAPQFVVSKAEAKQGEKNVAVTVSLKNNPGIASVLLDILYDTEHLKLTGFEYNKELINGSSTVPFNEKASSPCLSMVNGGENVTGDGVLATLYFEVSVSAVGGYPIVVSYDKNNVYNIDEENVMFEVVNGIIEIN